MLGAFSSFLFPYVLSLKEDILRLFFFLRIVKRILAAVSSFLAAVVGFNLNFAVTLFPVIILISLALSKAVLKLFFDLL